jgi:ABC-2 type transport system ATP-binding protein
MTGTKNQISKPVIVMSGLSKKYSGSSNYALEDLSLTINSGEVYGFLGPNGAGKSTTIRLLLNFLQPTRGRATIDGLDITKDSLEIRRSIGYLSGDFGMYPKMTGRQYLNYMLDLQNIKNKSSVNKLASRLEANLNRPLGQLSRGNRQKIGIIQAFMHNPKVLILDEPTSGLDPLMQDVFYELITEAKQRGACIFMSSHVLSEVQKMCDRVGIIREGKLISEQSIKDLASEAAHTFDITFGEKTPVKELKIVKGAKLTKYDDSSATLHMHGELSDLFQVLSKHKVLQINAHNLNLEESFMHMYENEDKK